MKGFFIVLMIVSLLSFSVLSYDYHKVVNQSDSVLDYFNFSIVSTSANNTYNFFFTDGFTSMENNTRFIEYPNISHIFSVKINITDVGISNHSSTLIINETNSNTTYNLSFYIGVILNPVWHEINIGEYQFSICSYQLPKSFSKPVIIGASSGSNFTLQGSTIWFDITNETYNMDSSESITIDINGTIPLDVSLNTYNEYVNFSFKNNITEQIKFVFEIIDCGIHLNYEDYLIVCNIYEKGSPEYNYCLVEANNRYTQDWLYIYAQYNRTEIVNITQNVTQEVIVEVLRANKTLEDLISSTQALNSDLTIQIGRIDTEIAEKDRRISQLEEDNKILADNIKNMPSYINQTSHSLFQLAWQKAKQRGFLFYFIWVLVIAGLTAGVAFYVWDKNYLYG